MKKFNVIVEVERVYSVEAEDEHEALKNYKYADYDEVEITVIATEEGE